MSAERAAWYESFASRPHRRPLPCGGVDDQSCSSWSQLVSPHTSTSRLMSGGVIPANTGVMFRLMIVRMRPESGKCTYMTGRRPTRALEVQ